MKESKARIEALSAYRLACETHKRADWRIACHKLAAVLMDGAGLGPAPVKVAKPAKAKPVATLAEFLAVRGIRDEGGEMSNIQADRWHKARPFQRRLVRPDGVTLETAANAAWEAGYFPHVAAPDMDGPDNMHAVTPQMLIDALDREMSGQPIRPMDEMGEDYWMAIELERFEREGGAYA